MKASRVSEHALLVVSCKTTCLWTCFCFAHDSSLSLGGQDTGIIRCSDFQVMGEAWENISFKSWRAGKATECLKTNMPVGELFGLGEWKSDKSALMYADEDIIDPVRVAGH